MLQNLSKKQDQNLYLIKTSEDVLKEPSPSCLIEEILYEKSLTLLSAYAGEGKSLLSLSFAQAIASGEPLWETFLTKQGPVVIVDEENPLPFLKDRLSRMGLVGLPIYFLHYQMVKVDEQSSFNKLVSTLAPLKPSLIIFDSLIRFYTGEENDSGTMSFVMGKFRELLGALNTTILIIHHDRKSYGETRERVRGSGDIVGAVDVQLSLRRQDEQLILSTGKTRVTPFLPVGLRLNIKHNRMNFLYTGRV